MAEEEKGLVAKNAGFLAPAGEQDSMSQALSTREQAEIQAAFIMAINNPRNEAKAFTKIQQACKRPGFAEGALYCYPRGGNKIEGPSVKLAREQARCWGNLRYGWRVTNRDSFSTTIEGYCLDLEANSRIEQTTTIENKIFRRGQGWITPDERDYREMVSKAGAILVRNSILQILPPDITEESMRAAKETQVKAAKGELEQDHDAATRRLALAFRDLFVTVEMLEENLGHGIDIVTPEELTELRNIYTSIRAGQSKREDHFNLEAGKPEQQAGDSKTKGAASNLNDFTTGKGKKKAHKKPSPAADENGEEIPEAEPVG